MQISYKNIEILQSADYNKQVFDNLAHHMNEQQRLEIAFGKDMGRFATLQRKFRGKVAEKLPLWHTNLLFCTAKSYEQCTNQFVAFYKAEHIFVGGKSLLSLTGGLGVDDVALSAKYENIISLDTDEWLNEVVKVNNQILNIPNIKRLAIPAEIYLLDLNTLLDVYVDPDRRAINDSKGLDTTLFSPNVLDLLSNKNNYIQNMYIKLSPATDIHWIFTNLGNCFIHIIEFNKEVKELLCCFNSLVLAQISVHVIGNNKINAITEIDWYETSVEMLWEPCAAINKSQWLNKDTNIPLHKITDNGNLWIGLHKPTGMYGACKAILLKGNGGIKQAKKALIKLGIYSAGITCKNYPSNPITIRKELKLKEGSAYQIYFAVNLNKEKCWYIVQNT